MSLQVWRKSAFILAIIGAIQFIILLGVAMVFYAGGNIVNPSAPGYSIWFNSWSDLGRTVAWSGNNNLTSQVLFSIAMVVWGISFVPSIQALPSLFSESKRGKLFTKIGSISAVICVVFLLINVFLFPVDLHPYLHGVFAILGYLAFLIVEILFALVMFWDDNYPNTHATCFLAVAIVIIIFLITNAAILQKTVSITFIIATVIVFSSAWKTTTQKES